MYFIGELDEKYSTAWHEYSDILMYYSKDITRMFPQGQHPYIYSQETQEVE